MSLNLKDIPREKNLSKADFINNYLKPQRPVVIEKGIKDWPAFTSWNLDYFKSLGANTEVPLYDDRPVSYNEGFNEPHAKMKLKAYIELLQSKPTNYRIFLWNILKVFPKLQKDFKYPDFNLRWLKSLPMLFFGGEKAFTFMHYDIDLANIFHIHFEGKKQCILFDQKQNNYLYKVPFSLITHEGIDFSNPDFKRYPKLLKASGWQTELNHGDILYIPEGYWHYMKYITPGFSMSLRAVPKNYKHLAKAIYNLLIMRSIDNLCRKIKGEKWLNWKNTKALN